jgi:hypothetical protein
MDDLLRIDHPAARGTIDPARVYRGRELWRLACGDDGFARDPQRFRCGVKYIGVTESNYCST